MQCNGHMDSLDSLVGRWRTQDLAAALGVGPPALVHGRNSWETPPAALGYAEDTQWETGAAVEVDSSKSQVGGFVDGEGRRGPYR